MFIRHIEQVCRELTRGNAEITTSCGMHCHISAKDFSYFDLFKLCRLYCKVEDGLFSVIAPSRRNNRYCERSKKTYTFTHYETFKQDLITALYGEYALGKGAKPSLRHHNGKKKLSPMCDKYNSARYHALNLHSFFYRGTIEFRHHQGTTNAHKATRWGMMCASILDAAQKMTLRDIDALSDNGFDALLEIISSDLKLWATERKQGFGYSI